MGFEERPLDFDRQVADTQVKQLLVAETVPGESVAHGASILSVAHGMRQVRSLLGPLRPSAYLCGPLRKSPF